MRQELHLGYCIPQFPERTENRPTHLVMKDQVDSLLKMKPRIKAKELASQLGVSKKAVNAILYGHPECYHQDENYRWVLLNEGELVLFLPSERWVNADGLESALDQLGPAINTDASGLTIHVSDGCKLKIDCTARLLALANQLAASNRSIKIDFTACEQTRTYLDRAGFFDHLDTRVVVVPDRPAQSAATKYFGRSETLVEFGSVDPRSNNLGLIKALTAKFVQQSSDSYEIAAFTVFSELIGNVAEHSDSVLKGFAGLQKYTGKSAHIQTVVSDSGLGIAETLRPALQTHYPDIFRQFGQKSLDTDIGLVRVAMGEGNISRYGKGRGLGFKSSKEQALKHHASFSVRQEQFSVRFEYRNGRLVRSTPQTHLARLQGTHISFEFFVD